MITLKLFAIISVCITVIVLIFTRLVLQEKVEVEAKKSIELRNRVAKNPPHKY